MARTIDEIKTGMTSVFIANETIITFYNLDRTKTFDQQFSKLSFENILFYIVSAAIWLLESIFDIHKADVEAILAEKTPHSLLWYRNIALLFQYGYSLLADSDKYETVDEGARIIKFAAASETNSILNIKVAKNESGSLAELLPAELTAFTNYMARVKDAGVTIRIISQEADHLRLVLDIYYDPLVLDENGQRLDGTTNTPAQDAITAYLQNLPFDGEFSIMALTDALQATEGIKIPQVLSAEAKYGTNEFEIISAKYRPEAGWLMVYDGDLTITWKI